jgi:hypothetical protein
MNSMMGGSGMRDNTGSSLRGSNRTGDIIPKGYKQGQLQQFGPEQMSLFKQLFSHLGPESYLSRLAGGDEDIFNQIEAPSKRQFQGGLSNLASRFSGQGTGGRMGSSFQKASSAAYSNFSQDLASRRQELQRQAISDLLGLGNQLLGQRPQEKFLVEKQQKPRSFMEELLLGLSGGVGQGLGAWATGGFA